MVGRTVSHYFIEQLLGAGGMGAVYLARDLALGRQAAIKVVGNTYEVSLRQRLLREAEASARLQHPAIATFYESGETDAGAFIAMEYVPGRTLRERLGGGPMKMADALATASALLEALNHAHAAGILHRDIKPENIMLSESGTPKLLDFGLARITSRPADDGATIANLSYGQIMGTFGYMPPEQLRGEEVDARGDLFSLGAVLYEMVVGRAAFPGAHPTERIAAILGRDPPPPTGPGVSAAFSAMVMRALAKEPTARYSSALAMLSELRALAAGEHLVPLPQSLAVVDLRNLSGTNENDWIGSGIAESLTTDLARVPGLTVVSRDKVLRTVRQLAAGVEADALEIGRLLGCRWTLSGSFQLLGAAVRITTTLAEVTTGDITAAEKLDGSVDGIFDLQDRLSQAVAASLNLRLPTPAGPAARDMQAFELHARGRRLWQRLEKGTLEQAGELYRQATAIDPAYAPALSGLAALHAMRFTFTTDPAELERAADYARRAIRSDPRLADPHVWLGYALMRWGRMDEALAEEQLASELDPGMAFAPYFAGAIESSRARPALPFFQRAVTLDPTHGFAWIGLGIAHLAAGSTEEARWCIERAVALEGKVTAAALSGGSVYLGECLRIAGDLTAAREACLAGLESVERSDHMYRDTFRGIGLCVLARTALDQEDLAAARAALHQLLAHINGRERTLGGGFLAVQAMAGLARAGEGGHWLRDGARLFDARDRFNFSLIWMCSEDVTLLELARAALALGQPDGTALLHRARDAGSIEAKRLIEG